MAFKYELKDDGNIMVVQDPIYGEIEIKSPFKDIILTKEMRRLEKITQTGFSKYDYPGLENNERLSHSVGAFYLMSQIVEHIEQELERYDIFISQDDKDMALCSMLLHDIGHGPFSHSFEQISEYSHEKRTTDILLGDTEVNKLLTSTYGKAKVKRIASYIAEIDEYEDEEKEKTKSSFTKLLKSLISHQLDADRLDYLVRDAYHAGIPSAISYKNIVNSLGVSVNSNQEYELLVDRKGLTSIETVLIERYQRYRDVYFTRSDGILEETFLKILERYQDKYWCVKADMPEQFNRLAFNAKDLSLEEFLEMNDESIMNAIDIIKNNSSDPVLAYLCDMPTVLQDYQEIGNNVKPEMIKQKLGEIILYRDLSNTFSVLPIHAKSKILYKQEESLRINYGNAHKDLSDSTHLIRPDEYLEKKALEFNPEILRIELGYTQEDFKQYREEINNMINELNKKPEEFELKYIMNKDMNIAQDDILNILIENGFNVIKLKNKENNDEYYDTVELPLLTKGGSLRIRKLTQDGEQKYKATYKMPTAIGEVYSSREEIEIDLDENSIEELKEKLKDRDLGVNLDEIIPMPLLNSVTQRRDIILEKNGVQVCLSFDNTKYTNYAKRGITAEDSMVEIEALGNVEDRVMLNEINDILKGEFENLQTNKQSKYERGMQKTAIEQSIKREELER